MTSLPQNFKIKKNLDIFVLLVSLVILSYYPDIDISHWLRKDAQLNLDKVTDHNLI